MRITSIVRLQRTATLPITILLLLHYLITLVSAQDTLQLTYPPSIPSTSQPLIFHYNNLVPITWTTSSLSRNITLQIYQGPDDQGRMPFDTLLNNVPSTVHTYTWSAHNLRAYMTVSSPFHLYLYYTTPSSHEQDPADVPSNSTKFSIQLKDPSPQDQSASIDLKLGLGIGLGVGIPVIAAVVGGGMAVWCCLRRRRRRGRLGLEGVDGEGVQKGQDSRVPAYGEREKEPFVEADAQQCVVELPSRRAVVEVPGTNAEVVELPGSDRFDDEEEKKARMDEYA